MATWVWVVIAIAVVAAVALVAVVAMNRRSAMLRDRFGPEYDRVVESRDDRRAAEADLRAREKQRAQFDIKPLPEADRLRFAGEWRGVQERFLDQPTEANEAADALIIRVMEARGYPMRDFDAQAELLSVDYPDTIENYRFAHAVQLRSHAQQASTEDLREALLRYRSLFDELLRPEGNDAAAATSGHSLPVNPDGRQQPDGLDAEEGDGLAGPAASDTDYHDRPTGHGVDNERR